MPSLVKIGHVFLEKIFKSRQRTFVFWGFFCFVFLSSSLGKGCGPSFEQRCFVPSLDGIGQVVLEKKIIRTMNNGRSEKLS